MVSILWLAGAIEYESVSKKKKKSEEITEQKKGPI